MQKPSQSLPQLDWEYDIVIGLQELYQPDVVLETHLTGSAPNCAWVEDPFSYFQTMMIVRDLARHFTLAGKLQDVIDIFKTALSSSQDLQGGEVNVRTTVWLFITLGILLDQAHDIIGATEMQKSVLSMLDLHSPDPKCRQMKIWTTNELGRMYRHQHAFVAAETMHASALSALEEFAFEDDSIDLEIAWTRSTLARAFRRQGRFDEAIAQSKMALDTRTRVLGPEHPHVLWVQSDVAQCHFDQDDFETAASLHREVAVPRTKVLGAENADTIWTKNNLGVALAKIGETERVEARVIQEGVLECQERGLGPKHPHTE